MPTTNPIKRSNRIVLIAAVLALGAVVVVAKTSGRPLSDPEFVVKAAQGSYAEVALGRLAAQKGRSETVRAFGQRMATDHTKAKQKLEKIAAQENVRLPEDLDKDAKQTYENFETIRTRF
jgi:putative membrane protein